MFDCDDDGWWDPVLEMLEEMSCGRRDNRRSAVPSRAQTSSLLRPPR